MIGGDRLLSEAIVVAVAWAISTYVVFHVIVRLTGNTGAAIVAASLLIMASARGYSYPKGIVYAVAALLWWKYVRMPTAATAAVLGAWAAVAFYWRPDHGIYVALALALAVAAAHGFRRISVARCSIAAATMLALMSPFLLYVQLTVGLLEYVQTGFTAARVEHVTQGPHQWPLFRLWGSLFTIEPAERYAPTIGIRWSAASSAEQRRQLLERYDLNPIESDEESVQRVKLSARALSNLRGVISDPIVEDTAGIDRASGTLPPSSWSSSQQWMFEHAWLRVRVFPTLDAQARGSELTVALFHALPILMIVAAPWMAPRLRGEVTARSLVAFAAFALLIDLAMLRSPFTARAPDAVLLSAIVYGCVVAWMWRAAARPPARALLRMGVVVLVVTMTASVAIAGRFDDRLSTLAGGWTSLARARSAWNAAVTELFALPPLTHFIDQPARFSLRLAAYVRECVPREDRLLVLWFEPEIYYYADRLVAQRHLVFTPAWAALAHEQRMTLERVKRFAPPIALARRSALESPARASYPGVVEYVEQEYQLAATAANDGEEYSDLCDPQPAAASRIWFGAVALLRVRRLPVVSSGSTFGSLISVSGNDVDLGRDVRIALADHHRSLNHLRRPVRLQVSVRHWLQPIAAKDFDTQTRRGELMPERFGVVDATVTVVQIDGIQAVFCRQQAHHYSHLSVQAAGVGHGREDAPIRVQPRLHAREDGHRIRHVLEHVAEDDVVEGPARLVLLQQTADDVNARMTLAQLAAERLGTIDTREIVEVGDERRRGQPLRRSQFQAGAGPPVAGEDPHAMRDGG